MQALKVVPEVLYFDTFEEFAKTVDLGKGDILVTNEWMYNPYVKPLGLDVPVIFQEKYGKGEPSDEMIDAMSKDMAQYSYNRIIAFGGARFWTSAKCCHWNYRNILSRCSQKRFQPRK